MFSRTAPLSLTPVPDPGIEDRSGPSLSRGSIFTLLAIVASEELSPEILARLKGLDPEAWYRGQDFETIINQLEDKDAALPELLGRNIYFMYRTHLQQAGIVSAEQLCNAITSIWAVATRGGSGTWRCRTLGERYFVMEAEQPYNCLFEMGALRGFVEAFDGREVQIEHQTCRRRGDPFCTFEARWEQ